jgi:hypothetical protein
MRTATALLERDASGTTEADGGACSPRNAAGFSVIGATLLVGAAVAGAFASPGDDASFSEGTAFFLVGVAGCAGDKAVSGPDELAGAGAAAFAVSFAAGDADAAGLDANAEVAGAATDALAAGSPSFVRPGIFGAGEAAAGFAFTDASLDDALDDALSGEAFAGAALVALDDALSTVADLCCDDLGTPSPRLVPPPLPEAAAAAAAALAPDPVLVPVAMAEGVRGLAGGG